MELRKIFFTNLHRFRKERNLTQEKFAELCDISTNYVGYIEKGKSFPSVELIEKMAKVLAIEPHLLFISENSKEKKEIEKRNNEFKKMEKERLSEDLVKAIKKVIEKY